MDKEFIGIILLCVGMIVSSFGQNVRSILGGLIVTVIGCLACGFGFMCYGLPFAGGMVYSGFAIWASSFIFVKIFGENILVEVVWISRILGLLALIAGLWITYKIDGCECLSTIISLTAPDNN